MNIHMNELHGIDILTTHLRFPDFWLLEYGACVEFFYDTISCVAILDEPFFYQDAPRHPSWVIAME
jgi:hypothetical protein